jgi:hypothetical protein
LTAAPDVGHPGPTARISARSHAQGADRALEFAIPRHTITTLSEPIENFPGISPDGRYLLYSSPDPPAYEIMLVNNFR